MDVICSYVQRILEHGMAYVAEDGVYFDVKEFGHR
jgi:cysteinyl-tRNA synthetase